MTTPVSSAEVAPELAVDWDQIIRQLDESGHKLPEVALRLCQAHPQQATPRLIEVLQEAARLGREGIAREGNAHFYALFLLTEFQATESLQALLEVISLPGEMPEQLFEDAITEVLPRALAVLAADRLDLLESLFADRSLNEYVRSGAVRVLGFWVRDGRLSRSAAIEFLRNHLRTAMSGKDVWLTTAIVSTLTDLNPLETMPEIEEAFARNLVDESMIDLDFVREMQDPDEPQRYTGLTHLPPTKIADTVAELRKWAWYSDKRATEEDYDEDRDDGEPSFDGSGDALDDLLAPYEDDESPFAAPATIHHAAPRVGRNDPCPCGSGKKFKKCCLRSAGE